MHLDAALFAVVARAMTEGGWVELAAKLVIDAREQVEVEGCRNAGMVVVGGGEYVRVFDEIDADHEQRAGPEYRGGLAQQRVGLVRFEVADGGAGEKADARPVTERCRKREWFGEIRRDRQHPQIGHLLLEPRRLGGQERAGYVDRHIGGNMRRGAQQDARLRRRP